MTVLIVTEWKTQGPDSFLMPSAEEMQHALETNNVEGTIPADKYDQAKIANYDAVRSMMIGKVSITPGLVGIRRFTSFDNTRRLFVLVFESLELYTALQEEMAAEGLEALYQDTRTEIAALFGLDVMSHQPVSTPDDQFWVSATEEEITSLLYT